ncbi:MAG: hypothetical protein MN733_02440 [Nitrososphaera sp.]|nr:hypothetical protein [Nitrososphaera sp.]
MTTGRFPYKLLPKYPHMKPEDIAVWERWIRSNPSYFDTVDYDVLTGLGATPDPTQPENIQRDHVILTKKKIDVVGYKGNIVTLVEVGPIANARKLGQILLYQELYTADHPQTAMIIPAVCCGALEREIEPLFLKHGIMLLIA